jgi:putative hemolysin
MSPLAACIVIVVTLCLAAFAAGSETAVVACSKVRLYANARAGFWRARILRRFVDSPEYFFSVVLVATDLAVVACTAAATDLAVRVFGNSGIVVATAVMVPVLLVFGEVIPKSVFLYHADRVATAVAPVLQLLAYLLWPIVMGAMALVRVFLKIAGADAQRFKVLATREDLIHLYRTGKKDGELEERERLIIDRVFRFERLQAMHLMIPMERVVSVPVTASVDEVIDEANKHTYSHFPVVSTEDGRVVGIVSLFDLLGLDGGERLDSVMHAPVFVRESEPAERLLAMMKGEALHMTVVVSDRGETRGIMTLENIVESIIGDIYNEYHDDELRNRLSPAERGESLP